MVFQGKHGGFWVLRPLWWGWTENTTVCYEMLWGVWLWRSLGIFHNQRHQLFPLTPSFSRVPFLYSPGGWKTHIQVPEDPVYRVHFSLNFPSWSSSILWYIPLVNDMLADLHHKSVVVTAVAWGREFMVKYRFHIGQPRDFHISSFICPKVVDALESCFGSWETTPSELNQNESKFGSMELLQGFFWLLTYRKSFFLFKCVPGLSAHSQAGRQACHIEYPHILRLPYAVTAIEPAWKAMVKQENGWTAACEWLPG